MPVVYDTGFPFPVDVVELIHLLKFLSADTKQVMEFTDFHLAHLQLFLDKPQMVRASECYPQFASAHITQIIARTAFHPSLKDR